MDTAIAYLVVLSLPLWLVVEELLHRRETGMAVDIDHVLHPAGAPPAPAECLEGLPARQLERLVQKLPHESVPPWPAGQIS